MILAKVIGTVVSTRKDEKLTGLKFLLLGQADSKGELTGDTVVAADAVGAGEGEYVLYASGSSARQTVLTDALPVDAVGLAIVASWEIEGEERYKKGRDD